MNNIVSRMICFQMSVFLLPPLLFSAFIFIGLLFTLLFDFRSIGSENLPFAVFGMGVCALVVVTLLKMEVLSCQQWFKKFRGIPELSLNLLVLMFTVGFLLNCFRWH